MSKKYLFSPVGNTDPIKYFKDGSMLHICRVYKPDVVYLYLSKEMYENHLNDNRYVKTLEFLGEKLNHKFDVRIIARENLINVQQYDIFYQDFRECILEIKRNMNEEDKLFLNMASGTPAMKSALIILATLAEYRFIPVQVSTPQQMSNLAYEDREQYDVQANWELDEDNEPDFENRCVTVHCMNLMRLLKIDIIKKHIKSYDYHAALEIAKEVSPGLKGKTLRLLEAAESRVNLDWKKNSLMSYLDKKEFCPVREGGKRKLFEYALVLSIKLKKGEYADFVRAITPLIVDLLELSLKVYCGEKLNNYTYIDKNGVQKWDAKKLKGTEVEKILLAEWRPFNYGVVYSTHLEHIIKSKSRDGDVIKCADRLVNNVEKNVRNLAAHEIVSITDESIREKTGMTSEDIMKNIQTLCEKLHINSKSENWYSYEEMNEYICKCIDEDE